jgi:hypothetical protein
MIEARIGRVAAAALHESLAAHLPFRVEFYEHWLQPPRLRSGSVGMASFLAVLSFLRQEGDVYAVIVEDAGRHAADWVFAEVPALTRWRWRWLPRCRRVRAALRLVQRLTADATPSTRCRIRWREGRLALDESPFCNVRANVQAPLCGFYAAALRRFCELTECPGEITTETCRGMGAPSCTIAAGPAHPMSSSARPADLTMRPSDRGRA